ncbi:hypothetical protein A3F27_02730 [Candidatus Kaiserbacteria bacterium RIFCSPHIGHO2_12_FULL_53_13]|uniref:HAD family hydrolase n=1 Tax=Candidatus Kaiserbacteria bacterium RIFCSPHIGHO2_12_FULL_53_13 TaxID=1798502 RepID=A0A1F6EBY6_9BACT|nr:MAG: hypothetical protein A3F27_02730 [Candidatus Kaiserbacteria bacterium RIFCSPHIGHO2_12_FULL_53_13]OGG74718.1 MAG: hypothetical protein A3A37_02700 [Candidatus Kaiserbacteria bacterium RIFCSPLOWO2_01_FULL_52_36]
MIKLVVFDWNGVLIADTQATLDIDNHIFRSTGRKQIDIKTYREKFTMPVRDFFVAMGFSEEEIARESRNVQKLFHSIYEPRIAKIRTRGGARQLLQFLKDRNIEAVILSNHTKEGLQNQLERLGIGHHFSRVITNDMHATMERKNKADKLAYLVKKSSYKKNEILIIGDSPEEAEAGKRAGIRTVAITGGYYSTRRLKEAKPDYLIHNLLDMIDIIKKV